MIISIDYGSRYIGVAITDPDERLALRHSVIDQKRVEGMGEIRKIVEQERITTILVGVPVSLSGNESAQTKVSKDFMTKLQAAVGEEIKVEAVDETLTSVEADARIKAEGGNKEDAHMEAARIMLEDYLTKLAK